MAAVSPSLILLTGQNYVKANAAGSNLDGGTSISIAVTFDPNLIGNEVSGTVVAKHNPGAAKYGWKISYDSTTGFATGTIWDVAAGTNSISIVSTKQCRGRTVVVLTYSTSTTIHIYVDGVPADGVVTGPALATIAANNEPLALGCDSASTTPANLSKGGLYYLAIWSVQLVDAEVATILADAVTPIGLRAVGYQLRLVLDSSGMTADSFGIMISWIDTEQALLVGPFAVSGALPRMQLPTSPLLLVNDWGTSLADVGLLANAPLNTTYALSAPWRLWANGATPPRTALLYRTALSDATIYTRARRIAGQATTIFFETVGISLQYDFSTKEMFYYIIGDDMSGGSLNRRVSFGFNQFPVEGTPADLCLRVNSQTKDADLFIGATKFPGTGSATNANIQTTRLILDQAADFNHASVVPACLTDQLSLALIAHNEVTANSRGLETHSKVDPAYPAEFSVIADLPTVVDPDLLPQTVGPNYSRAFEMHAFTSSPYPVIDDPTRAFVDPMPVIDSVTVDSSYQVTGIATAGPTDAYLTYNYWEIELDPGVSIIIIDQQVSTRFFASRTSVTNEWGVPLGSLWNGLRIRFVIQSVNDSAQMWFSDWVTLDDPFFDHESGGGGLGVYTDPYSSVQSVTVDALHNVTAVVMSGPINPTGSSATLHHWEVEMDTGQVYACAGEKLDGQINMSRVQIVDHFKVPLGEVWNCRRIRFAVRIEDHKHLHHGIIFYSDWYRLRDPNFDLPGQPPVVVPIWPGAVNPVSDNPIIPPLSFNLFDVREFTFTQHSALFPVGSLIVESMNVDPSISGPQWFNNGAVFEPGLYTIKYTAGSRHNLTSGKWNDFFQGAFATGSRGMWIQSGLNFPYYVFQAPAFLPDGYDTQNHAETAAIGYEFVFYHLGGKLGVIFDLDNCSYTGSISLELRDTQGNDIPGVWELISASSGSPTIVDPQQQYPTLLGLEPGQVHLRYRVLGTDTKARWQETYLYIWPSPHTTTLAQALDPNAPEKPIPADQTGSAALIRSRTKIVVPPPTSGNR